MSSSASLVQRYLWSLSVRPLGELLGDLYPVHDIVRPAAAGQGHYYGDRPMVHSHLPVQAIPDVGIEALLPGLCFLKGEYEWVKLGRDGDQSCTWFLDAGLHLLQASLIC